MKLLRAGLHANNGDRLNERYRTRGKRVKLNNSTINYV